MWTRSWRGGEQGYHYDNIPRGCWPTSLVPGCCNLVFFCVRCWRGSCQRDGSTQNESGQTTQMTISYEVVYKHFTGCEIVVDWKGSNPRWRNLATRRHHNTAAMMETHPPHTIPSPTSPRNTAPHPLLSLPPTTLSTRTCLSVTA